MLVLSEEYELIQKRMKDKKGNKHIFDEYQRKVYFHLEVSEFSRFMETKEFRATLLQTTVQMPPLKDLNPGFYHSDFYSGAQQEFLSSETMTQEISEEELDEEKA